MARTLFLNRYFHPDHSATSQMLGDLAFALAREGRAITVITSRMLYDDEAQRLPAAEEVDGVRIVRVWTSRFGRANLLGRAIDYLTFYLSAAMALLRLARAGDIVVAKTDPPMLSVVVGPIVRLRGAKLVNWLQDIFPEVAVALGVGSGRATGWAYRCLTRMRNRSLHKAAMNVVLGQRMDQRLAGLGIEAARRRIIPNWADGALVRPVPHADNPLRQAWDLSHACVVAYSGNLGRAHDSDTFLSAIETIERQQARQIERSQTVAAAHGRPLDVASKEPPRIVWLFIGGGAQLSRLRAGVQSRGLTSVRFEPYQPREHLAQSLSVADVHLISLRPELEGLIVPSKYYGIAAAGRPCIFIGARDGEIARILEQTDSGLTIDEGDGPALAQAVLRLAATPEPCRRMGANARRTFEQAYDIEVAVARWRTVLDELVTAR